MKTGPSISLRMIAETVAFGVLVVRQARVRHVGTSAGGGVGEGVCADAMGGLDPSD